MIRCFAWGRQQFIKGIPLRFRRAYDGHPHAYFTFLCDLLSQLSRCSNFDLNSRKILCRDEKLIERTVNTFPSAATAFRVRHEKRVIDDDEKRVSLVGNVNIVTTGRAYRILWFWSRRLSIGKSEFCFQLCSFSFHSPCRILFRDTQNVIPYCVDDFLYNFSFFSSSRISALITQCNSHFTFATFAIFFV